MTAIVSDRRSDLLTVRYDFDFWPDRDTATRALEMAERVRDIILSAVPREAHP